MEKNVWINSMLYVDGQGAVGYLNSANLPELALKTEDFRPGGTDGAIAIDMGMEPMTFSCELNGIYAPVLRSFGVAQNAAPPLTVRGALRSDGGAVTGFEARMQGLIVKLTQPSGVKPGEPAPLTFEQRVARYEYRLAGELIHLIDFPNSIRIVDGVDQLAEVRQALGLGGIG